MKNSDSETDGFGSSQLKRIAAASGMIGSLFLMLTGVILSAVSYFERISFHGLDVVLLIASFIALGIGSHCLDLLEKEKRAQKVERCRKYRLVDECSEKSSSDE